jgi:tetratricopeptide (TPR) repeat protein
MNAQQFLSYIRQPERLSTETLSPLKQLTQYVPYCQISQALLALNQKLVDDILYNDQFKKAVAYSGSRLKLKYLLEGQSETPIYENLVLTEEGIKADTTEVSETITEVTLEESDNRIVVVADEEILNIQVAQDSAEINIEVDGNFNEGTFEELRSVISKHLKVIISQDEVEGINSESDNMIQVAETQSEDVPDNLSDNGAEPSEEQSSGTSNDQKNPELLSKKELIERFIKLEPKISSPKKEFFNPVDKARQSCIDHDELVSETLARVQMQQGNIDKAIKIYEKLILLYPEKRVYFATQIKNIEEQNKF